MTSFISIDSKKTDKVDFVKPITNYIKSSYSKDIAELHKPSVVELNNFRENIRLDADKTESARTKLLQYYNLLCSIEKRIPISESGGVKINFYWYDSLSKKRCSQYSLQYEKQCVLFNIAALETQIGTAYDKTTDDGIKQSAKYYQLAAGTFQHLKDLLQGEVVGTPDFSQNFFAMVVNIMLAQAQECTYEKALKGGLNDASLCKLASQVHLYYEQIWGLMISPDFKNFLANVWIPIVQIKVSYYRALSFYHMANVVFKEDKYGEQVAWLQKAYHQMADVNIQKIVKNIPPMRDIFAQKFPMIVNALKSAENDNNKIYHEHVPAQLPSLTGKSIVKPSPFTPIPSDYEPFKGLIPLEIKQSLSIYDEKKAQIIRSEIDAIDDANDIAKSSLSSMNLPGSLQALENPGGIPEDIMRKIQQFRNDGAVSRTLELAITLDQLAEQSAILLRSIDEVLDREEAEDTQIRSQLKEKWTRSPSHALTSAIRQEINKFKGNLDHARKSDALIRNKFKDAEELLQKLANNDISTIIPKGESVVVNSQIVDQLKFLLRDLDQLIEARNALTLELRTLHSRDDISVSLLNAQIPADSVFQEELKKYTPIITKIRTNLQEQERLLSAIGDAHQQFARGKSQNSNSLMSRDIVIQQIHVALTTNSEVLQNLSMGINFYTGFQEILNKLKRRSEEFAAERARDKQDLLSKLSQASQYQPQQSQYQPQQVQQSQYQVQYSQYQPQQSQYQPQVQVQPQFQSQFPPQYSQQKSGTPAPVYQNMPPQSPNQGSQAQYVIVQGPNGQQQLFPASSLPKWN